jgi:hypothetical protein
MTLSATIARRLMRWTTHRPPPDRAIWALAMQREYDALERGELGWALGCASAMAGWKLRENWLYLALLLAVPFVLQAFSVAQFALLRGEVIPLTFFRSYGATLAMLGPLPLAMILGAYRPDSIRATLLVGCLLLQHVVGTLYVSYMLGGSFLSWWGPNATMYMAPPIVGLCASLGIWYFGASAGARWARRRPAR